MSNNAMSNETDLDWLAMNVHVWPAGDHQPWCYVYWKGGKRAVSGNCITAIQPCVRVEMSEWLARRAELQSATEQLKPSIEEANRLAQEFNPFTSIEDNQDREGVNQKLNELEMLGKVSHLISDKRHRKQFTPFVSIEDNQDQVLTQQQDNGWFERGELPPVGVECEAKKYGKEEWYKVVICGAGKHLGLAVAFYEKQKGSGAFTCSSAEYFRPIRTEHEQLTSIIDGGKRVLAAPGAIADAILAAGFSLSGK